MVDEVEEICSGELFLAAPKGSSESERYVRRRLELR